MHKHQYAATPSVPMHDDVTTYCTPQKKDANWSWGSDQTFLGLEPEPGGYGHWVVCMPCAQMLVSPLCDTCPGICLERSLRLKVSVEVTSGGARRRGPVPTWARRAWTRNPGGAKPSLRGRGATSSLEHEKENASHSACFGGLCTAAWAFGRSVRSASSRVVRVHCWIKVRGPGCAW